MPSTWLRGRFVAYAGQMSDDPDGDHRPHTVARRASGRHEAGRGRAHRGRHVRTSNARSWALAVTGSIAVLSVGIVTINTLLGPPTASSASADAPRIGVESLRGTGGPASRDFTRTDPSPSVAPERILDVPAPSSSPASTHKPVAGLTQAETDNAVAVVNAAAAMNLPRRAALVAITTALQESHLRNLANS